MMTRPDDSNPDALKMVPRAEQDLPVNLAEFDVPHSRPFLADLSVTAESLSTTIEHVSNIEYVRWLDRAAELHADSLGWTRASMLRQSIMWFVARHEIDYLAEVWADDQLIVATWVREFRRVKSWRDYVILRPSDQTLVCRASTLWVLVDLHTRKPIRIPAEMLDQFDPLSKSSTTTHA